MKSEDLPENRLNANKKDDRKDCSQDSDPVIIQQEGTHTAK